MENNNNQSINNQAPPLTAQDEPQSQNLNQTNESMDKGRNKNKIILGILIFAIITIFSITGVVAGYTVYQRQMPDESYSVTSTTENNPEKNLSNNTVDKKNISPSPTIVTEQKTASNDGWQTYTNNDFGYSIKYPKTIEEFESEWEYLEFNDNFGNANSVGFRPKEIREDVLWAINVYTNKDVEEVIADIGDQFDDKKEIRENISINGKNAILTTITTSISPNWITKTVVIEKDGNIYSISNGAINNPKFENFYKSFTFTN